MRGLALLLLVLLCAIPASAVSSWALSSNGTGVTDTNLSVLTPTTNYGSGVLMESYRVLSFEKRLAIRFDYAVFVPPEATRILDAQLSLYLNYSQTGSANLTSHRVTESWVESQATWNNRQTGVPWSSPGGTHVSAALGSRGWSGQVRRNISVADAASGHWNGTYANNGFLLKPPATTNIGEFFAHEIVLSTLKPWLYVLYVLPSPNPSIGAPVVNDFSINWSWINPTSDPDFSTVEVLLNGTLAATTTTPYFNASVPDPSNCRTISLRSVNVYGDRNQSWVNRTDCASNTVPPPPVSGLFLSAVDWNFARWNWTNPQVSDFAGTDVFINSTLAASLGPAETSYNATGFQHQETPHFFTVRARDNASNFATNVTLFNATPRCELWTCAAYSVCSQAGDQSRACTDSRGCGTTTFRPELAAACVPPNLTQVGFGNVTGFFSYLGSSLANFTGVEFDNETPATTIREEEAVNVSALGGPVPYVLNITTTGNATANTVLHFNVPRTFVEVNGLDPDRLAFYAFNSSNGSWGILETIRDPTPPSSRLHVVPPGDYHYHVVPAHFSLFAPTGPEATPAPPGAAVPPAAGSEGGFRFPSPLPAPSPEIQISPTPGPGWLPLAAAVGLAVAVLIWLAAGFRLVRR